MGRATAHPNRQCISSEDIHGTEVYGPDAKHIGEIDHLIIDKLSGRVAYAVMSFGGFMGLGHKHYPVPWGALTYDTSLGGFRTNITEQQLRDAPEFSDDSWQDRDWEARTHRHYGAPGILGHGGVGKPTLPVVMPADKAMALSMTLSSRQSSPRLDPGIDPPSRLRVRLRGR